MEDRDWPYMAKSGKVRVLLNVLNYGSVLRQERGNLRCDRCVLEVPRQPLAQPTRPDWLTRLRPGSHPTWHALG